MNEWRTLRVDTAEGVCSVLLNRPEQANAISLAMAEEMRDLVDWIGKARQVRAVLVSGAGRFFCGGGDLGAFDPLSDEVAPYLSKVTNALNATIAGLMRIDAPVVAAINGPAAGAGFSLACACDFVVAARSATMTPAYSGIGLNPDGGLSWSLPRLVGTRKAMEIALLNRKLTATEALELGIISEICEDAALLDRARSLARQLADGPTRAFGETKRLINASLQTSAEAQLDEEARAVLRLIRTDDFRQATLSFKAKRRPTFSGG